MNRKRGQLQSYIAGIFDGEGTVGVYKLTQGNNSYYSISCYIGMKNPMAIGYIKILYPDSYEWYDRNNEMFGVSFKTENSAYKFLKAILPFTIVKHEQVKVALSFIAHKRRDHIGHGNRNSNDCERCQYYGDTLKRNKRVNSVNLHKMLEYRANPEDVQADKKTIDAFCSKLLASVEIRNAPQHSSGEVSPEQDNKPMSALEQEMIQPAECVSAARSRNVEQLDGSSITS